MREKKSANKIILLSGGGTGGSVTPLLAVAAELLKEDEQGKLSLLFVGTKSGPEQEMVAAFNREIGSLRFIAITSGKWRRYISFRNFLDVFKILAGFFQAFFLLTRQRPAVVISAGAFVSVPLVWAAALKKIPVLIHQQDVRPGLANKLMAPFARVITVTFEKSIDDYGARAIWVGNPVAPLQLSRDVLSVKEIKDKYSLDTVRPLVFVTGGGTGAQAVNALVFAAASELVKFCQIIHLTGKGKLPTQEIKLANYQVFEFLNNEDVLDLMRAADLIISRAGMSALSELSFLNKAALLIPMPKSHQEENAAVFARAKAAVVLRQDELTAEKLSMEIKSLLANDSERVLLSNNIGKVIKRGAAESMAGIIWETLEQ